MAHHKGVTLKPGKTLILKPDPKPEQKIYVEMTREDHTFCQHCKAPYWEPHRLVGQKGKQKPCPNNKTAARA